MSPWVSQLYSDLNGCCLEDPTGIMRRSKIEKEVRARVWVWTSLLSKHWQEKKRRDG
jgi:hypothetical protein